MEDKRSGRHDINPSDELETLRTRHRELESRLAALARHVSLSPHEQSERARLKKEKLALKDRMQVLAARSHTEA
jgi:hypothetical protein